MNKNELINEYRKFLINTRLESSVKSYVNDYLLGGFRNVINPIFEKTFNKKFDVLEYFTSLNLKTRRLLCELFVMMIKQEKDNRNSGLNTKTLSNYNASFIAFSAFNDCLRFRGKDEYDKLLPLFNYSLFFTKKEIIDNFEWRINTQDRFYEKKTICLPCRLLSKIYQKGNDYTSVVDKMLNGCKVLIDGRGHSIKLKQVRNISIVNGEFVVCYGSKGTTTKLYTEVNKKGNSLGYAIQTGDLLRDISLDHDNPLFDVYRKFLFDGNAPTLRKLSDDYCAYHRAHMNITQSALACHYYNNRYSQLGINEQSLLKEVDVLFSCLKLTIMDRRINSSKNKN